MAKFLNPSNVHAPVGSYSHTVTVPPGTELLFISGQIGMRPDGSLPASFAEQAEVVFANIHSCLATHGLGMEAVVKLTSFLVPGQDVQVMREIRQRHFGEHRPTSTAVFVPQLVNPAFLLEVEAVAVKAAAPSAASSGSAA
jgi:enamine deaminase RidA (YjgF/YER057c/UK114 family)